jgi:FlaA1/EpsC-like NDP-sugar epimerase/lipopolysaccharide/colanic/teichoic acid biosynthesis glycosyltransferase
MESEQNKQARRLYLLWGNMLTQNELNKIWESNAECEDRLVKDGLPRFAEVILALLGLIIVAPIIVVAAILIRLTSNGSVIFRQERVGRKGKMFVLYKLRTMYVANGGTQVTVRNDGRMTGVGKFLRRMKIDELPELWNVLKGDMSLVGPRPEVPCYVNPKDSMWRVVLEARPGLTDPTTLRLRNEENLLAAVDADTENFYLNAIQPFKLRGYVQYLRERSWKSDLRVLWQTILSIIFPEKTEAPTMRELVGRRRKVIKNKDVSDSHHRDIISTLTRFVMTIRNENGAGENYISTRRLVKLFLLGIDTAVFISSFVLAYLLRFDFNIPSSLFYTIALQLVYVVLIQSCILTICGIHSFIWRYVGIEEVKTFVRAMLYSLLPIFVLRILLPDSLHILRVPLSVILIDAVLAFGGVLGLRVLRRIIYERQQKCREALLRIKEDKKTVLLIGAGRAGVLVAREIQNRGDTDLEIKGFVDDDLAKAGSVIQGVKVIGTTKDLPCLARENNVEHVVIALAQASHESFRRILDICRSIPVKVQVVPGLHEILQGHVQVSRLRDVQIEDLLGRDPIRLDEETMAGFLADKRVMVTGAGGSIGSELVRQIALFKPSQLLLVERAEFALFNIDWELRQAMPDLEIVALPADVNDETRMRHIFDLYRPQVILHAAAHKHVPLMEYNPTEAVKNNVLATNLLGVLAGEFGAETFVLISTDKAVRPTSVMGATKRIAELVIQSLNEQYKTNYVAVRFGNVIGSAGSVIPIFREQIRRGGPVTITHPDMERYFMTIEEAAQLVLQAGAMGKGGEIFILDMGEPVKILDLAKDIITLSGLRPNEDIEIVFTGVRPGEKLFEELQTNEEQMTKTRHPKIYIGKLAAYPEETVQQALQKLQLLATNSSENEIRLYLNSFLSEAQLKTEAQKTPANLGHPLVAEIAA